MAGSAFSLPVAPRAAGNTPDPMLAREMDLRQDVLHTMLDGLSELIYVCDMETHRLLYLNEEGRRLYGVDVVGGERLCYQVLQGRDEPCPFCTNGQLSGESFFEWEFTNPVSRRHYLLRDRLVDWDGRPARLEIVFDMTERQRESESFKFLANAGSMVVDCIRVLEGEHAWRSPSTMRCASWERSSRPIAPTSSSARATAWSNTHEWCGLGVAPQRRFLQDLPVSLIDEWVKRFDAGEAVIIEDVDQLPSLGRAAEYEVLKSQDIASLVAAPIEIDGTFAGYLGVDNPRRVGELGVVKSPLVAFASFVSARMKREIAQRQVAELTWNDSLTCAHSRAAFHRDFDRGTFGRIGFVLVDADRLAVVNREQGHSAGDEMLCRIASCLREVFGDAVYRIGDDEFCAVSTSVDYNRFAELAERAAQQFHDEGIPASLGPAWHETCTSTTSLLDVAGDRMRSAKRGRHRAVDLGVDLASDAAVSSLLRPGGAQEAAEAGLFTDFYYISGTTDIVEGSGEYAEGTDVHWLESMP